MPPRLINRRSFLRTGLAGIACSAFLPKDSLAFQQEGFRFDPDRNIIPAPATPGDWPEFRRRLAQWRETKRGELNYSDALYRRADFAWVTKNFSCCFLMLCDELFYDRRKGQYTVKRFVEEGLREFGGYDSVVLWHAYPRIGLDDRNQFDFYRDMPGGLAGLRTAADDFHRAGLKVFIDYNPWDTGTRRENKSDLDALCDVVSALGADGIFLDTMDKGAAEFRAKLDAVRPGVVLEGEGALPLDRISDHHASWAQQFDDSEAPGILRNKWFERRHLQHQIRRWNHDHTAELQTAWMNGSGMMVWENVFGSWVGWNPRDRSLLRSLLPIQRRFSGVFCGEQWTPLAHAPGPGLFASLWESDGLRLWTLANRTDAEQTGELPDVELRAGERLFDLIAGAEVGNAKLRVPPRGIACLLAGRASALGPDFGGFLKSQRALAARADRSTLNPLKQASLVAHRKTKQAGRIPADMAEIGPATVELKIQMRNRECGFYDSNPPSGHRLWGSYAFSLETFTRSVKLERFAIDLTPVTNRQFAEFLRISKHRPKHVHNFLKHWRGGNPAPGTEDHPVVYVALEDARAYARWAGKRLPTEEEWQYAAQGTDGRKYPWGNEMAPGRCNGADTGGTTPVRQFPEGRSPFGLFDLCGNVWEWTESERTDGRTRFCILRGGAFYSAKASGWYMDGGPRPVDFAAKFLLMWAGLDRCATVGFRCVMDL